MKGVLLGGRFDGAIVDLGMIPGAPELVHHWAFTEKEVADAAQRSPDADLEPITYRRSGRIRSDGCVIYVLKGAAL